MRQDKESEKFKNKFKQSLFLTCPTDFGERALALFRYQAVFNNVYGEYLNILNVDPEKINSLYEIPFLPIEFFKSRKVVTGQVKGKTIFESSATTGMQQSRHYTDDRAFYERVCETIFRKFYGSPEEYVFLALLPSYLERKNSSLVCMADRFIRRSGSEASGFYLYNYEALAEQLHVQLQTGRRVVLLGVTFALLDVAEALPMPLGDTVVMETGGMKGRGEEKIREEVHEILKRAFNIKHIHSEYGMTELFSQAYAASEGVFRTPPWMRVLIRDINDPFDFAPNKSYGGINVIDLANVDSCAFIATDDLGSLSEEGFRVLGRVDHSDIRGCNIMFAG